MSIQKIHDFKKWHPSFRNEKPTEFAPNGLKWYRPAECHKTGLPRGCRPCCVGEKVRLGDLICHRPEKDIRADWGVVSEDKDAAVICNVTPPTQKYGHFHVGDMIFCTLRDLPEPDTEIIPVLWHADLELHPAITMLPREDVICLAFDKAGGCLGPCYRGSCNDQADPHPTQVRWRYCDSDQPVELSSEELDDRDEPGEGTAVALWAYLPQARIGISWQAAVKEALAANHILKPEHDRDPERALADLVTWERQEAVALEQQATRKD